MIPVLIALYLIAGTAVATETFLRLRAFWLKEHVAYNLDREDLLFTALAGLVWPLTLVAFLVLRLHEKREARRDGAA